jgi:hypothetical protein
VRKQKNLSKGTSLHVESYTRLNAIYAVILILIGVELLRRIARLSLLLHPEQLPFTLLEEIVLPSF